LNFDVSTKSTGPLCQRYDFDARGSAESAALALSYAEAGQLVIATMHGNSLDRDPVPTMYIPMAQMPDKITALNSRIAPLWWIVQTRVEPHSLAKPIAAALREASGGLPVAHIRSMDEIVL